MMTPARLSILRRCPTLRRLAAPVMGAAICLLSQGGVALAAPSPETKWGLPHDASTEGWRIDWLINVTSIFVTLLFVIMCIWMVYAAIKHGPRHTAEYDHGDAKKSVTFALGLSAVIFFVVDGNLWVNSIVDLSKAFWDFERAGGHPTAVRIQINAHQWAWDARYAGPDGKFNSQDDIVTLNDIRVPVKTPVILQIASTDVIHSFYLPNFRVKQDAMPGMINRMWFEAKETGEFDIACAQHCGVHHYKMKGQLTVLPEAEYRTWAAQASLLAVRSYDPNDKTAHWGWDWNRRDK